MTCQYCSAGVVYSYSVLSLLLNWHANTVQQVLFILIPFYLFYSTDMPILFSRCCLFSFRSVSFTQLTCQYCSAGVVYSYSVLSLLLNWHANTVQQVLFILIPFCLFYSTDMRILFSRCCLFLFRSVSFTQLTCQYCSAGVVYSYSVLSLLLNWHANTVEQVLFILIPFCLFYSTDIWILLSRCCYSHSVLFPLLNWHTCPVEYVSLPSLCVNAIIFIYS
jgi:sorbitol-specific phosphotransferase system component IIBC